MNFRSGDIVTVRSEEEVLTTLDDCGMFEGIPFTPEMKAFCGRTFRVFKRADKICVEGAFVSRLRDSVFLEGVRCDGLSHNGCGRMCLIFWKEAWLKRAAPGEVPEPPIDWLTHSMGAVPAALKEEKHRCQSVELPKAVEHLSGWDPRQYLRDIISGNFTVRQVFKAILINFYNMAMRYLGGNEFGAPVGKHSKTPAIALNLQRGELVEVRSRKEILATVDAGGKNRGLRIDYEMLRHAGKRFRVLRRVDRIILEVDGKEREIQNTVLLDGTECEGLCRRGCSRSSYPMWREAWLRRIPETDGRVSMNCGTHFSNGG